MFHAVLEVLVVAERRLTQGFCLGRTAVDVRGEPVSPSQEDAVAWSLIGSVTPPLPLTRAAHYLLLALLQRAVDPDTSRPASSLTVWESEPGRTKLQVLAVVQSARAALECLGAELAEALARSIVVQSPQYRGGFMDYRLLAHWMREAARGRMRWASEDTYQQLLAFSESTASPAQGAHP